MANGTHIGWLREGVTRWNKRRKKVSFAPNLEGADFFALFPTDFRDDPKTSRTFEKIDLSGSNLRNARLSNVNFRNANFTNADLHSADMSLSNFDSAKFVGTNLSGVNGVNSTFIEAIFEKTDLSEMQLEGANLEGARLIGVQLSVVQRREARVKNITFYESRREYRDENQTVQSSTPANLPILKFGIAVDDRKKPKNKYDVFFGTNREPIFERGALTRFNGNTAPEISYGLCEVIVPEDRRMGSLGSPLWKRLLNRKDDRLSIDNLIALDEELFFRHVTASAEKMNIGHRPTIFIHGFNNSFEAAVLRAAQIGFDLGIGQGVGLFSWPSKGKKRAYSADEAAAEASKYILADFIQKFVVYAPASSVDIIAHSMGCRCLLGALEVLSNGRVSVLRQVNQVILAAADVDTALMPNLGLAATQYSTRTTSYVSDHDRALKLSGWLHDYPRVGFVPPSFVMTGMDTILVNDDDLGTLSHGYVGSSRTVLADIYALLSKNVGPDSRFSVKLKSAGCWQIKN